MIEILYPILLGIKFIIFTNLIKIEQNRIPIIIISTLISLIILALIYNSKFKYKKVTAISFYVFISILMLGDAGYFAYFNQLPSLIVLKQAHQLTTVVDSIKLILDLKKLALILDIPLVIYFSRNIKSNFRDKQKSKTLILSLSSFILIFIISMGLSGKFQSLKSQELYIYHINDFKNLFLGQTLAGNKDQIFTFEDLEDLKNRTKLKPGKLTGLGKGKNLIVIQVEGLQEFVIDFKYDGQEITPNLNALISNKSSVYFDNYYQLLGRGNTSDAEFVSNNSLHPSMEEPTYKQYGNNTFYGLPWLLRDNDYNAWVFHGYEKSFWDREEAYVNQGFQRFLSEEDFEIKDPIGFGIKDEDFFQQSLEYIKKLDNIDDNPFYSFLITLTSHTPFVMPKEHQVLSLKEKHKNSMVGDYLQSIHYADKQIGKFIEDLKLQGLYDSSIIALYGDHFAIASTNETDQKLMTDLLGKEYDYDTMMKIPLLIHLPGEDVKETISNIGSQIDFYPTIMNIMGYDNTKGLIFGRDLTNYQGYNYVSPQTYMQKGSFIDNEVLFAIARDGIFDHSKAIDLDTRKPLDLQDFRPMYEHVIKEINKSNYILKEDLLKDYIENEGKIKLNENQGLNIKNKEFITIAHYNSLEELDQYYEDGYRLISADIQWTKDEEIVLLKEWYWYYENLFEKPIGHPTLKEFKNMKMKDNQTQMSFDDLLTWSENHTDVYIVLRTTEDKDTILVSVKDRYKDKIERFIPEVKYFQHYFTTTYQGFKNVILNISEKEYTDKEILDFVNMHPYYGIIMTSERSKTNLPSELKKSKVLSYSIYEGNLLDKLLKKEIKNIYKIIK